MGVDQNADDGVGPEQGTCIWSLQKAAGGRTVRHLRGIEQG